jgi:hypothetical protein
MQLVKLTMLRKLNQYKVNRIATVLLFIGIGASVYAQDNSPYSRYGLGNQFPNTGAANRAMGGISAAYNDYFNINFNNAASYSFFQATNDFNSHKLINGRAVLDIGIDGQGRTLMDRDAQKRFSSSDIVFSRLMLGMPLRKNWGMALGLRPITRINYKMEQRGVIIDHNTNLPIDSGSILYEGQGGLYLASIGTGVKFKAGKFGLLSLGVNTGYMFGKTDYSTRLTLGNDSTLYAAGNIQEKKGTGGLYFDAGAQYLFRVNKKWEMGIGIYGNIKQRFRTSSDVINETYTYSTDNGYLQKDSVSIKNSTKGSFDYPAGITAGFILRKPQFNPTVETGWLMGFDFTYNNWDAYRMNKVSDPNVRSNWTARIGAELNPVRKKSYFSLVSYRAGIFTGPDYLYPEHKNIPTYGISIGAGFPLINYNTAMTRNQLSILNLGFEYVNRGNNKNIIKENLFRVSAGFSLTDLWFWKKKYTD